ncbi:polysaccharide deacetylase family protein [Hoeflea olei]|uniref:Chitooligosaccharide deacetylase n=1 Tax=Hoeflea olei TaxID=1480615 RepID=A0A1C1YUQ0_9HYPH|nr:polysaccharide deacetylase family protein [Hoeflea olei]OCW57224.1 polysaccharide deacetylase [Hoeflea olei]
MVLRLAVAALLSCLALAGCASKPSSSLSAARTAYGPGADAETVGQGAPNGTSLALLKPPFSGFGRTEPRAGAGGLAGRTLRVASISDIRLNDKEVILTFDDGPMPGKTDRVLDVLSRHGVKATFLMVGQMAAAYPAIATRVADHGHSIGSHTYNHANLVAAGPTRALADIESGNAVVAKAAHQPVGFFRFPYLADTGALRHAVTDQGLVILDVDIDTKDYFKLTPETIAANTMARVRSKRKGIILMHDIHARTAAMLPLLLARLKAEGYKVVALEHRRSRMPLLVSATTSDTGARRM